LSKAITPNKRASNQFIESNLKFNIPVDLGNINDEFYWRELSGFLSEDFHAALRRDFPPLTLFEKHVGRNQGVVRPHDRYYLALGSSKYHRTRSLAARLMGKRGSVEASRLPRVWQLFIENLRGPEYRHFLGNILQTSSFNLRFAWHMSFEGCEVSPHRDNPSKLGTHIFYFNSNADWNDAWGGQTVILSELRKDTECPEFEDFSQTREVSNIGNNSLLFRNSLIAWHGVRPISPPPQMYRKIFTVIFDTPNVSY
jgi:hypothetical protein